MLLDLLGHLAVQSEQPHLKNSSLLYLSCLMSPEAFSPGLAWSPSRTLRPRLHLSYLPLSWVYCWSAQGAMSCRCRSRHLSTSEAGVMVSTVHWPFSGKAITVSKNSVGFCFYLSDLWLRAHPATEEVGRENSLLSFSEQSLEREKLVELGQSAVSGRELQVQSAFVAIILEGLQQLELTPRPAYRARMISHWVITDSGKILNYTVTWCVSVFLRII